MRKTLNRMLACFLAVALLVSCCISGLVLPAAASTPVENLFPDGDLEGTLIGNWEANTDVASLNATAGFGGGKAWEVKRKAGSENATNVKLPAVTLSQSLKPGKVYVFRCKQTGGAGQVFFDDSGVYTGMATTTYPMTAATGAWNEMIAPFQVANETTTLPEITFYNANTTSSTPESEYYDSVFYDDFVVCEYVPGMELVPGGDGTALPITRHRAGLNLLDKFSNYLSLATDGDNAVWKFSGLNTAGTSGNFLDAYFYKMFSAGTELAFSFRYKGEGASVSITNASKDSAMLGDPVVGEADANGWKTYTAVGKINKLNVGYAFKLVFSGATEVLVDDFSIAQKVETAIDITEATATVEQGRTVTLNTTAQPANAPITWTSSDDTIATVQNGVVMGVAQGTVTITAAVAGGKTDTCEVTVTVPVPTYNGLFPNGDMNGVLEGTAWESEKVTVNATAGFGGGKAWEVKRKVGEAETAVELPTVTLAESLKPGKVYVFRCKQTGGAGQVSFDDSGAYTGMVTTTYPMTAATGAWNEMIAPFQVANETTTLPKITFYNNNTTTATPESEYYDSVYYDDFGVYEYVAGMNLVPGGDGTALPITRHRAGLNLLDKFSNYLSLATDGDNAVWKFSGLNTAGTSGNFLDAYFYKMFSAGTELVFSFRYKGEGASVSIANASKDAAMVGDPVVSEADANGWKTYTAVGKINKVNVGYAFKLVFSGATEVLVDDFSIASVPIEAEIDVTETTATVEEGKTVTLHSTVVPATAPISWSSSDNTIATVSNGVVTGVKAGTVTITAEVAGGKTDTCEVTVTAAAPIVQATSIALGKTQVYMVPNAFKTLQVKPTPADGVTGELSFVSSKPEVATVDENGKVTAVANGETVITVTGVSNPALTASCTVKVDAFGDIIIGGDFETDTDAGHWANFAQQYAEIAEDPADASNHALKIKPIGTGKWYKFGGLLKGGLVYKLTGKVKGGTSAKVVLNGVSKMIGGSRSAEFYPITSSDDPNVWKSFEATFIASETAQQSYFFQLRNDSTTEYAYFDDIQMVQILPAVESLSMNATASLGLGVTTYLNCEVNPTYADISNLQWTSSDASVATVDNQGKVTTLKEGTTTITVSASEDITASCVLTVIKEASSFALSKDKLTLLPGGNANLYTIANPAGAVIPGTIAWSSSNTAVATVDQAGKVTAVANGTATITCTNGAITVTCEVKVSDNGELIVGGDFQDNTQNWTAVADGTNAQIVDDPYEFGNKVLLVNTGKTTGAYSNLTLEADQLYMLTLRARGQAATVNVNSNIVASYYPSESAARKTTKDALNWNTFTIRFRTKASGTLSDILSFKGSVDGVTYIDDVSLVKLPVLTGIVWQYQPSDTQQVVPENSVQLSVAPVPSDAFIEKEIVWTTGDQSIAMVDQKGEITGVKEGNTTVTASVEGLASISLNIVVDYYAPLFSEGDFANPEALWQPTSTGTPAAEGSGIFSGIGENGGDGYKVLGKSTLYYRGTSMVLVPNNTYKMTVRYKSKAVTKGTRYIWFAPGGTINLNDTKGEWKTEELTFTVKPTWVRDSYQLCIASTEYTEDFEDIVIDSIDIRMYDSGIPAEAITISPSNSTLLAGESMTYVLTTIPTGAYTNFMTWTSSNENVAIVEYGKVTASGAGTATITATVPTSTGSVSATATVTVEGDAALIKNGTFDIAGDTSWTLNNATVEQGVGSAKTNGLVFADGSSASQTVTGMKAGSTYVLKIRSSGNSTRKAQITLKNADGSVVYLDKALSTSSAWGDTSFSFTLPETYDGSALTLEMVASGTSGTMVLDNILLTEGFSKVDLIVSDIVWNEGETQMKPGTPVNFTVVIANNGEEEMSADKEVVIEIRANTKTIRTITYKGGLKAKGAEGSMIALTTDANDPWLATEGELVISAHVNTTSSIRESNNKNNGIQTNIRVADEFLEAPREAMNGGFNKLVFSDDFDFANVDTEYTGNYGYKWYLTDLSGITGDSSDYYLTEDGIMLAGKSMRFNWLLGTTDGMTGAGWEGFTHGYLEYRTRFDRTPNVPEKTVVGAPAVWSFPPDLIAPSAFGGAPEKYVEIDWMEYWGNKYKNGTWTITLHDQIGNQNQHHMNNNPNHMVKDSYGVNDIGDGEWHTIGYRWEKGLMIAYLDGREIWRQEWGGPDGPNPPANVGTGEYREDVFEQTDKQKAALLIAGSSQHPMELDYIRVWQSDGTIDAKPALDNTFLQDHLTDADGNYFTEVTADNYKDIIDALFAWEEIEAEQQDVINSILKDNGGKTYGELLYEAQEAYNTAEAFVAFYACDEYGDAYTTVNEDNYSWILVSVEEWNAFTSLERAIVNDLAKELCGMTFDEMLEKAAALHDRIGEGEEPGDKGDKDEPMDEDTFMDEVVSDEDGNLITDVTIDNIQDILDAEDDWENFTDEQKEAINNALKENGGKTFEELLEEAKKANEAAEEFISLYAVDEEGEAFLTVDESNYEQILAAKEAWDALSDLERAIINKKVKELCGQTFEELYAAALSFSEELGEQEVPSPEDGVPFPTVAVVGLFLAGAAMIAGKKRRDEEQA